METFFIIIFIIIALGSVLAFIGKIADILKPEQKSNYTRNNNRTTNTRTAKFETYPIDESNRTFIKMDFKVVGIGFEQSTKDACACANRVYIAAEDNRHDKNAVAVYNQKGNRIGYIPKGNKEFLAAFHSYKGNTVKIINQYHNEDEYPVKYCELDIRVTFCGDFEYLKKVESEEPECYSLLEKLADIRKEIKNKELSDSDKYDKISNLNHLILDFNKRAEKVNWVTIPMKETIILMNKLKLKTQLEFIDQHINFTKHSGTQHEYLTNYIKKNANK